MKKWLACIMTLLLIMTVYSSATADKNKHDKQPKFRLGVDVLLQDKIKTLKNKRVGIITNPTGVNQDLTSIVDRCRVIRRSM